MLNKEYKREIAIIAGVVSLLFFLVYLLVLFYGHLHEDAYILFVYSENVAEGNGIRYSLHSGVAEGATDFLWMIALAFLKKLGIDTAVGAGLLNSIGLFVAMALMLKYMQQHQNNHKKNGSWIYIALLFAVSPIVVASLSGFGTGFYVGTLACLYYLTLSANPHNFHLIPLVALLVGLIRPDGVIIGAVLTVIMLLAAKKEQKLTRFLIFSLISLILGGIYFYWRYTYFGLLLPLPLYVKSTEPAMLPGLITNIKFFVFNFPLVIMCIPYLIYKKSGLFFTSALTISATILLIALTFATQSQNVAFRFQAPILLLLFFFSGDFFVLNARKLPSKFVFLIKNACFSACFIAFLGLGIYYVRTSLNDDYINFFPQHLKTEIRDNTVIAMTEAGRMAYWNKHADLYDLVGLNTPFIATDPITPNSIEKINPDLIFAHTAGTLASAGCASGNYCVLSMHQLTEFIYNAGYDFDSWEEARNPVLRAPLAIYSFLKESENFTIMLVRYGKQFRHFYAVNNDNLNIEEFLESLEQSFEGKPVSYFDSKAMQ